MITDSKVKIKILREEDSDIPIPKYMSDGASGMDIHACIPSPIIIEPFERKIIPSGFAIEIPRGYEAQIRPRSGLAIEKGISVLNSPGTIDSDYRGEVCVILINLGKKPFTIHRGDRIAQLVFSPVEKVQLIPVEKLGETKRAEGGFGNTGI